MKHAAAKKTAQQQEIHRNKTDKTWERSNANKIDLLCVGKRSRAEIRMQRKFEEQALQV
jgi:hypothetical protein